MPAQTITGSDIQEHNPLAHARLGYRVLVDGLVFESYTPYMGGDYQTLTIRTIQDKNKPGKVYISGYPTAKSLLGRMRWLARAAVAGYTGARTHKQAEEAKIKGTDIPLIPFIFGATKASNIRGLESLTGKKSNAWKGIIKLTIRQVMSLIGDDGRIVDRWFESNGSRNRYNALLYRGQGSKAGSKVPVKQGIIKFQASLFIDYYRAANKIDNKTIEYIGDFVASLLITTPLLIGLGQGSTRGFGRFIPVNIRSSTAHVSRLLDVIEEFSDSTSDQKKMLAEILRMVIEPLDMILARGQLDRPLMPSLALNKFTTVDLVNPNTSSLRSRFSNNIIEYIGWATSKQSWKNKCRRIRNGLPFHTWMLGLPRSQKLPGGCDGNKKKTGGLRTGYIISRINNSIICVNAGRIPWECKCIHKNNIGFNDIRRMSYFIIFPLPSDVIEKQSIAILGFKSYDLATFIDKNNSEKLTYLSVFNIRDSSKECAVLAVSIPHSLSRNDIMELDEQCRRRSRSLAGKLRAGIADPDSCNTYSCSGDADRCIDDVFIHTLLWLKKVLKNG